MENFPSKPRVSGAIGQSVHRRILPLAKSMLSDGLTAPYSEFRRTEVAPAMTTAEHSQICLVAKRKAAPWQDIDPFQKGDRSAFLFAFAFVRKIRTKVHGKNAVAAAFRIQPSNYSIVGGPPCQPFSRAIRSAGFFRREFCHPRSQRL